MVIVVTYAERIESEANRREHWRTVAARKKRQRVLDDDNLASGFKATRDGVADWLGVDDGDKRLTWRYAQEKGAPKFYGVRIEVEATA